MKPKIWFCLLAIGLVIIIPVNSCKKEKAFTLPELSTSPLTDITSTSAISGGSVTSDGGAVILARGVCWSKKFNPTLSDNFTSDGTGSGNYSSSITGLTSGIYYYVRAYAINNIGTTYGNQFLFITPVTDIEGNLYRTVIIGNQVWMAENLKTTRLNDNSAITNIADNEDWVGDTLDIIPGYSWYKNDNLNKVTFGALYNWYTVNTGKLCPVGWHVPSEIEWMILTYYLGGEPVASGLLKEAGNEHWTRPNTGASNEFGFSALPGGYRTGLYPGSFRTKGYYGWWWTSTETNLNNARARLMTYNGGNISKGNGLKSNGYSVRCIKN
jgi:uncharacterized protein (TIGR02145 family)